MRLHRLTLAAAVAVPLALASPSAHAQTDPMKRAAQALAAGKFDVAKEALGQAKKSRAKLLLEQRLAIFTGRYDDAVKLGKKAMKGGGAEEVTAATWAGDALAKQGKIDEAIKLLEKVKGRDKAYRANLLLGELLIRQGKRQEARPALLVPIEAYNNSAIDGNAEALSIAARSAYLLRAYRNANTLFKEAEAAGAKRRVESLLWYSELFLDKYDPGHAGETTRDAAKLAAEHPDVLVARAHVNLARSMDFKAAEKHIDAALKKNPNLVGAYFIRAGLALRTMDLAAADKATDRGLAVDPTNLELLSMKAATRFLADDAAGFTSFEQKVLKLNPEYSRFYSIVGEFAEWEHRYDDIVRMMRKAVKLDRRDAKAYATLGLNLIRAGEDKKGVAELTNAWKRDKFNVRVYNTLNLFEETIPKEYRTTDGTRFRIRYHKKEKALLERYLPAMLDEAWGSMVKRYGFTPQQPVGVEMYANPRHFSVRTSGLPNVGIQGVCFGKTLAALSPSAGPYNWGMVVWHELGHVFHIQRSKSHVPRWFTEGLAEYETIVRRPEWQREEDLALFRGLQQGKIPKVASFNRAFTHVDDPRDITMAYFAASQIAVFMAEKYGFAKVAAFLPEWAAGKRTPEVVQNVLGISADQLDKEYRTWLDKRLARYSKQFVPDLRAPRSLKKAQEAVSKDPKNAKKNVKLALAFIANGKLREAIATIEIALKHDPKQPDALYLKSRLLMQRKKLGPATKILKRLIDSGKDGYSVRMKLADLAEVQKLKVAMKFHLNKAHEHDPSQSEPIAALYDLARKEKDKTTQLWALRKLATLEQHDRRVYRRLITLLLEKGQWEEARKVGESAIFMDVLSPESHRLYARALARTGHHVKAIRELNSALLAKPKPKQQAAIYRTMAEGYRKLGRNDYADKAETFAKQVEKMGPPPKPVITNARPLRERRHEQVARTELLLEAPRAHHHGVRQAVSHAASHPVTHEDRGLCTSCTDGSVPSRGHAQSPPSGPRGASTLLR